MNKLCRILVTICALTSCMSYSRKNKASGFKIKPAASVSLHKRATRAVIDNTIHPGYMQGAVNGYIGQSAAFDQGSHTANHKQPGYVYINKDWDLLKDGDDTNTVQIPASSTNAIAGTEIKYLDTSDNGTEERLPLILDTTNSESTVFYVRPTPDDNFTTTTNHSGEVADAATGDQKITATDSSVNQTTLILTGDANADPNPRKYRDKSTASENVGEKYYILHTSYTADNAGHENIFSALLKNPPNKDMTTTASFNPAEGRDTKPKFNEYDPTNYYGLNVGFVADYQISEHMHVTLNSDLSTPLEKVTHTTQYFMVSPEIELSVRAGLSFGTSNGHIGVLYGINFDRSTATSHVFQAANLASTGASDEKKILLKTSNDYLKTTAFIRELMASISVTPNVDAFFSSSISTKDYSAEIPGLSQTVPILIQRYSTGISVNY